jgi:hypothetical protein
MGGEQMDSGDDVKVVFSDVGEGPPLGFDAHAIIERGGRIRRRRKRMAVLGTSVTTAAAIVAIALASGQRPPEPTPVEPAGPGISLETAPPIAPSEVPSQGQAPQPGAASDPETPPRAETGKRPPVSTVPAAPRTIKPTATQSSSERVPLAPPRSVVECTICPTNAK